MRHQNQQGINNWIRITNNFTTKLLKLAITTMLRTIMPILVTALVQIAAQFTPAAQLAAAAFAETAGIVVAPLAAMVDAFTAVATWVPAHLEPAFAGLLSQLRRLANLWIIAARGFDDDLLDGAIAFADRIQKLVGFVTPALAAIKALAEYTAAANLTAAVGAFVDDIVVVAVALKDGLAGRPVFGTLQSAYDGAIAFAERIQKLVGVITPGITAIKALAGYIAAEMK
jgi:hypothetical protein